MLNLLKMNLFRMVRTRTFYVMMLVALGMSLIMFLITLMTNEVLSGISVITLSEEAPFDVFGAIMSQGTLPGIPLAIVLFCLMFFSTDVSTGYAKNLVGYQGNKFACAGVNLITAALYALIITVLDTLFIFLLSLICYKNVLFEGGGRLILYLLITYVEIVAFTMLLQAWNDWRGKGALKMILGAVYVLYAALLYSLIDLLITWIFKKESNIGRYTLLGGFSTLTMDTGLKQYLVSGLIALAMLVLAYFLDVFALKKRELK